MYDNRYLSALATVLRGSALPYGYTITVWTSGMMLTHERGLPSVGEVFLLIVGAVAGFALLGLVVRLTDAVPFEPSSGVLRRTGMIQLLAVSGRWAGQLSSRLSAAASPGRWAPSLPPRLISHSRRLN